MPHPGGKVVPEDSAESGAEDSKMLDSGHGESAAVDFDDLGRALREEADASRARRRKDVEEALALKSPSERFQDAGEKVIAENRTPKAKRRNSLSMAASAVEEFVQAGELHRKVKQQTRGFQMRLYRLFISGHAVDGLERSLRAFFLFCLYGSVLISMLETTQTNSGNTDGQWDFRTISVAGEITVTVVLILELLSRLWSCSVDSKFPEESPWLGRLQFLKSWGQCFDLIYMAPMFIWLAVPHFDMFSAVHQSQGHLTLANFLRIVRAFRLLKFARYSPTIRVLATVVATRRDEIISAVVVCAAAVVLVSVAVFVAEKEENPQFDSQITALWWGFVTMTTVGYGDVNVVTPAGRVLAACGAICGISLFTLPAGVMATGFLDYNAEERQRQVRIVERMQKIITQNAMRVAFWRYRKVREVLRREDEEQGIPSPVAAAGSLRFAFGSHHVRGNGMASGFHHQGGLGLGGSRSHEIYSAARQLYVVARGDIRLAIESLFEVDARQAAIEGGNGGVHGAAASHGGAGDGSKSTAPQLEVVTEHDSPTRNAFGAVGKPPSVASLAGVESPASPGNHSGFGMAGSLPSIKAAPDS